MTFTPFLRRAGTALAAAAMGLALPAAWAQAQLPVAPIKNAPETFFGTTVDDPYRDFENTKSPAVAAWMKAHSDHAHAVLKALPGRAELREKLERYDGSAAARVTGVVRTKAMPTSTSAVAPRKTSSSSTCGKACRAASACSSTPKH